VQVVPVPQLADNYAYLVFDPRSRVAGVVDVAEAQPVVEAAGHEGVRIAAILSTHHHFDHVGGNEDLIARGAPERLRVYGYAGDRTRIPGITDGLDDGATLALDGLAARAIFIPAHTRGHLAYYFEREGVVFTGDTLFAAGCGRLFEGDAAQMMSSLARLAALPDDTRVYCGHEYTQKSLAFAAMLEPGNREIERRRSEVDRLRAAGRPTVPSTIALEKATNPFLRTDSPELRRSVADRAGDVGDDPVSVFAAVRRLKDEF
jgi:hydroxyacylglutathione hydrolase